MNAEIELIAGYWTLAGDTYPFAKSEVSPFPLRNRIEAAASAGYKGIGLLHVDLMAAVRKHSLHEIKSMLKYNGMIRLALFGKTRFIIAGSAERVRCDRASSSPLSTVPDIGGFILSKSSRGNTGSGVSKKRRSERLKLP